MATINDRFVVSLEAEGKLDPKIVGGKAANLVRLNQLGVRVPPGFCLATNAYEQFIKQNQLEGQIEVEIGRKPLSAMRWEELWDTALRIRNLFSLAPVPVDVGDAIQAAIRDLSLTGPYAVRSSAPEEDSLNTSFAGLHDSRIGVDDGEALLSAVRLVWASLWSDAALLYREELGLDVRHSQMAIVVQPMIKADCSGVAFSRDPRDVSHEQMVIEAVSGPCADLVDGRVDPDRWLVSRQSGHLLDYRSGNKASDQDGDVATSMSDHILESEDLDRLRRLLLQIEEAFAAPVDVEWTGRGKQLFVLQARGITTGAADDDEKRRWYLSLRPSAKQLEDLCARVSEHLIPQLSAEGEDMASIPVETLSDAELATETQKRLARLAYWRAVYETDFIPFAHGVRHFGLVYNELIHSRDPYEFVQLLRGQSFLAEERNRALARLADQLASTPDLLAEVKAAGSPNARNWLNLKERMNNVAGGSSFLADLQQNLPRLLDVTFEDSRLADHPEWVVPLLVQLAERPANASIAVPPLDQLEAQFLQSGGTQRENELRRTLQIARLSWRLRDDDNLLLGRVESQMLRALHIAASRLRKRGRLSGPDPDEKHVEDIAHLLVHPANAALSLPPRKNNEQEAVSAMEPNREKARQLVGQPASSGFASGLACSVINARDLGRFRQGQVLICDAIQPTMTHIVPLATAIVERRGGMLIHGAIIARELGVPCVNGVPNATQEIRDGELVTVDGWLGIVTVGAAEFELERKRAQETTN